ncbi:hypothetical protein V1264_003557 [Littorina saxatilis]|uniref:Uncharacterized protein n=1 Tax=Littorina saxatilis TaxID=31220 RepID=A0AAN9B929_9CAEN
MMERNRMHHYKETGRQLQRAVMRGSYRAGDEVDGLLESPWSHDCLLSSVYRENTCHRSTSSASITHAIFALMASLPF